MATANTSPHSPDHSSAFLRGFAYLLCIATFFLIFFGGQVKSHEAGLSVPDWPMTFGENPITYPFSELDEGAFWEHFHRLYAGVVGMMMLVLALWVTFSERRRWIKVMAWLAVLTVIIQAVLGGLTVIYLLPVAISSAHAILAQTFFALTLIIAYGLSKERRRREVTPESLSPLAPAGLLLVGLIYLQLFAGALMRHTESGLAIPDFPTVAGNWLPRFNETTLEWINTWRLAHADALTSTQLEVDMGQVLIHFSHRLGALFIFLLVLAISFSAFRRWRDNPAVGRTAMWLLLATLLQASLGAVVIWTQKFPFITSVHVMLGAGVLALAVILVLRAWPVEPVVPEEAAARSEEGQKLASPSPTS